MKRRSEKWNTNVTTQRARFLLTIVLATICGMAVAQQPFNKKVFVEKADSLFQSYYPHPEEPGAAVLVMKNGKKVFEKCYGKADLVTKVPITPKTNFCIASVSKQFSAVALMQLAEQGKLSLDDNLHRFFPEYKADFFDRITLRHILSHTSGLPDTRDRTDSDFRLHSTDIESCQYFVDLDKLNFEPGTKYEYMNPTFQLAYQIIPRVTGQDFDAYQKEHIFDVAGMKHTTYFDSHKLIERMAHGYTWSKTTKRFEECDYGETGFYASKADGCLYTSLCDFVKWEKALAENKVLTAQSREAAYTPHVMIPDDAEYGANSHTGYGYGFFIQQIPGEPKIVYHLGDNGGFLIYAGKVPSEQILVLIFANRDDIDRIATANQLYHWLGVK